MTLDMLFVHLPYNSCDRYLTAYPNNCLDRSAGLNIIWATRFIESGMIVPLFMIQYTYQLLT